MIATTEYREFLLNSSYECSHRFFLTAKSRNTKTGPIPVSTTTSDSCPESCPLSRKACYAAFGPLGMFWKKLDSGVKPGLSLSEFCGAIAGFPADTFWRMNQAGDLPKAAPDKIDAAALGAIVDANTTAGARGFTYTHYPIRDHDNATHNRAAVESANARGFAVNISCDTLADVDSVRSTGIRAPLVVLLPSDTALDARVETPAGESVTICPAQTGRSPNCKACGLCGRSSRAKPIRDRVIGFIGHGIGKKALDSVANAAALVPA